MANKYLENYAILLVIWEIHTKTKANTGKILKTCLMLKLAVLWGNNKHYKLLLGL